VDALRVTVRRGATAESVHLVHAVAVHDGAIIESAGDPGLVTFMRSAAKPLQALPLVRARSDLEPSEIAIASASHRAEPAQLAAVESLLARAGATETDLECGADGTPPRRLNHNCSGKHAGMLALCAARGWQREGYRLARHPVQGCILAQIAAATELDEDAIATGVDGCGVLAFALPLERMAAAFAFLPQLDGGAEVVAAMRAYPELIRGPGAPDTVLMQGPGEWVAKGGAEAVLCASSADGIGIALKVADGAARAVQPALAEFLRRLGRPNPELGSREVRNSRGEVVGEIAAETFERL
jgi:L-asparaginase II